MNWESSPKRQELVNLVHSQDDKSGHHVLWVDNTANVHISKIPEGLTPIGFEKSKPEMKLRLETLQSGNDYVVSVAENLVFNFYPCCGNRVTRFFLRFREYWQVGRFGMNATASTWFGGAGDPLSAHEETSCFNGFGG